MGHVQDRRPSRVRRLSEELFDEGFSFEWIERRQGALLEELEYALHPNVHERRIPSFGSVVEPANDPDLWEELTSLAIDRRTIGASLADGARYFADGLSSWTIRRLDGSVELAVFDRAAGSERDLVVLAKATGGCVVQRHPAGIVRAVGPFGVLRYDGIGWHHEEPIGAWLDVFEWNDGLGHNDDRTVLGRLLEFAVHDLGARGIGALLVYRAVPNPTPLYEARLPVPPTLRIGRPADLAPLRHVLAQIDGAAVFDGTGTLRELGVRLLPSPSAVSEVDGFRGMRHTAGRRHSYDDDEATIIVVSEDGPVSVWRNGAMVGGSKPRNRRPAEASPVGLAVVDIEGDEAVDVDAMA